MKDIRDLKLEAKITEMLMEIYHKGTENYYEDMVYSDLDGVLTVKAMDIITLVRKGK